ncbi:MAG: PhzF family phenazine biosynthesis protein [Candidatus Dadabacteria bacterium]|nr:PhzF family phenazine biosynthesis protein [Candidatus Dadabacteria bacterium]NIS10253.1 PhzF family phenazine biosynthesis protein [Candidatus Dadabacteria bacterium]NIV43003.1 PhzF family phenazine biosynthesis isomerase [Candidatus Dadabacteria bacterium]NIX16628.1 PhzF family phenazine biosynthesis isomerase [Candidatus Dadabacteria bacterium]NIY23169.1 PhzF family phenazine biosynthesis isomerase [Candidatus Dadabacteria bacterium]
MKLPIYQIDAFTSELFRGNPAAVCPLDKRIDESLMQSIAAENNLSETAFFVKENGGYRIRWFTPTAEVDLCGHATLASAFVIFNEIDRSASSIQFFSNSGELNVTRDGDLISLDFPSLLPKESENSELINSAFNIKPIEVLEADDYLLIYESQDQIENLVSDLGKLKSIDLRGVIVSSKGDGCDFVSRFFAPKYGIDEDPVTGSAHCTLTPYWSEKLGKKKLHAKQLSKRGGELFCEMIDHRVCISGHAVIYLKGEINHLV